ncbi:MAG: cytochrome C biogenesis protein [Afipia sp.]|nr:cytochrome C biogenesis protein [Afipia sp.]
MTIVPARFVFTLAGIVLIAAASSVAFAEDSSPWVRDSHSAVRLVAGSRSGNAFLGGIDFEIQDGWKTYWRTPGDSGVPPRFDFSRSDNVENVTILWPAPMKFPDGNGGLSLGYKHKVLLPLRIVAKDSSKPVTLRATINYGICEKLCVPVEANAELNFISESSTEDNTISAALDTVPKPAKIGDAGDLVVRDVKRDGKIGVIVNVVAKDGKEASLFAEGPTPDWALPVPKLVKRESGGAQRFAFDLDGLPSGASTGNVMLKLTLTGGAGAYEYNVNLK